MSIELHGIYYGVADAAETIGCTVGRMRQLIRAGDIDYVEVSPRVCLIPEAEVERLRDNKPKHGRPRVGDRT